MIFICYRFYAVILAILILILLTALLKLSNNFYCSQEQFIKFMTKHSLENTKVAARKTIQKKDIG